MAQTQKSVIYNLGIRRKKILKYMIGYTRSSKEISKFMNLNIGIVYKIINDMISDDLVCNPSPTKYTITKEGERWLRGMK